MSEEEIVLEYDSTDVTEIIDVIAKELKNPLVKELVIVDGSLFDIPTEWDFSNLTSLSLDRNHIGSQLGQLGRIISNSRIESLSLRRNDINAIDIQEFICNLNLPNLKHLFLSQNNLRCEGANILSEWITVQPLETLHVSYNMIGCRGITGLATNLSRSKIQYLSCMNNPFGLIGLETIINSCKEHFILNSLIVGNMAPYNDFMIVDPEWNTIEATKDNSDDILAEYLACNSPLTSLVYFGSSGLESIASALTTNTFLTQLNIVSFLQNHQVDYSLATIQNDIKRNRFLVEFGIDLRLTTNLLEDVALSNQMETIRFNEELLKLLKTRQKIWLLTHLLNLDFLYTTIEQLMKTWHPRDILLLSKYFKSRSSIGNVPVGKPFSFRNLKKHVALQLH